MLSSKIKKTFLDATPHLLAIVAPFYTKYNRNKYKITGYKQHLSLQKYEKSRSHIVLQYRTFRSYMKCNKRNWKFEYQN